jgi:hypothetical protein
VTGKSTRITVDLGSDELVKSLKIAAIEHRRTVRDIVVESLAMWLTTHSHPADKNFGTVPPAGEPAAAEDKDYRTMMETLNRYRGLGGT